MYREKTQAKNDRSEVRAVFFDAVGTLFHPRESVGEVYARIGAAQGFRARSDRLEQGFRRAFRDLAPVPPGGERGWWRRVVAESFAAAGVEKASQDGFGDCFEEIYAYYSTAGAWSVYDEVPGLLEQLRVAGINLWVVSNFDERLPVVLDLLGLSLFFDGMVLSAEVGAAKPHAAIFAEAVSRAGWVPAECLHAGDDPDADWKGARSAGLRVFELRRPENSLSELPGVLGMRGG